MATLGLGILGAGLGFLAGGPAGAKLGWSVGTVVGSIVDAATQPGTHTSNNRLSDLKVSGSNYGASIPISYGKTRIAANIIWVARDSNGNHLIEHASEQSTGGKGGPSVTATTYTYSASFAASICRGSHIGIADPTHVLQRQRLKRVWADDLIVWEEGATNNLVDITFHDGSPTQTVDTLIASVEGTWTAYRDLVYIRVQDMDLTNHGNRLPNISCEMYFNTSFTQININSVITDLCQQVGITTSGLNTQAFLPDTDDLIDGYLLDTSVTAQDAITTLLTSYFYDMIEVDGLLTTVKRGQATVLTIDEADLGATSDSSGEPADKVKYTRTQDIELPGIVNVTYFSSDDTKHFEQVTQRDVRSTGNSSNVVNISLPLTLSDNAGKQIATTVIDSSWIEREAYHFSLPITYLVLAPADCVNLPVNGSLKRVRIVSMEIGLLGELIFDTVADEFVRTIVQPIAASSASIPAIPSSSTLYPVTFIAWSGAELRPEDGLTAGFYVAGTWDAGGNGGTVYYSPDGGSTWAVGGFMGGRSTFGITTSTLAPGTTPVTFDTSHTVGVSLVSGSLASTTDTNVILGNNVAVLGNEIVGFSTATITSTLHYTLSRLYRGMQNSSMTGHSTGERFVLASSSIVRVGVPDAYIGSTVQVKVLARGQTLADVTAVNVVIAAKHYPYATSSSVIAPPTQVGQILYSADGLVWIAATPVIADDSGLIVVDDITGAIVIAG